MNYTYILRYADGSLYCGWTNHLNRCVGAHNLGKGAGYIKGRRPITLVHYGELAIRGEVMKREAAIKKLSRRKKLKLTG